MKDLFDKARRLGPADRAAFVRAACGTAPGGKELADEVLELLAELDDADGFLDTPTDGAAGLAETLIAEATRDEGAGSSIGPYRLLELIGEGGFGLVYMAEQERPLRRRVALKVIKLGMDTKQVIARFEQERQALAMMDHPNIARVLDAGATPSGRPYFVMELVRGLPITEYCDERQLGVHERLAIFSQVCEAVQHAHQKGIIHRDIKPSNVLVTIADGDRPMPKVIDFGIAKATQARLTEKTLFTEFRQMIGTPEYMSPEQAGFGGEGGADIDTRSDVYSLGVLLYELLTGVTPFDPKRLRSAAFEELRRIIREVDPPRPSTRLSTLDIVAEIAERRRTEPVRLRCSIRGELDWIVMRCLEKERVRRYATAADIAKDIGRHLAHEPLDAGPPGAGYRARKFIRRNRRAVVGGAMLLVALILGLIGTTTGAVWAIRARVRAERSEHAAFTAAAAEARERMQSRRLAYGMALGLAAAGIDQGNLEQAREALARAPEELRGWEWSHLAWACDRTSIVFDTPPDTRRVALSGDGKLVFTRADSGEVRAFAADSGRLVRTFSVPPGAPWVLCPLLTNTDGSLVITSLAGDSHERGVVTLWDSATGRQLWSESSDNLCGVSFSAGRWRRTPDGAERVGLLDDRVLDTLSLPGESIWVIHGPFDDTRVAMVHTRAGSNIILNLQDGRSLARFGGYTRVKIDATPPVIVTASDNDIISVELTSGATRRLGIPLPPAAELSGAGPAAFGVESTRGIIDIRAWPGLDRLLTLRIPRHRRDSILDPDGHTAYVVESSGVTRAIELSAIQPYAVTAKSRGGYSSAICPTGLRTATAGWGSVCVYDARSGENLWSAYPSREALYAAAFSSDGRVLAVGGRSSVVTLLDAAGGQTIARLPIPADTLVTCLAWSPSGDRLVAGLWSGAILEFNPAAPDAPPVEWPDPHSSPVVRLQFAPDGARALSASRAAFRLPGYSPLGPGADSTVRLRRMPGARESQTIHQARRILHTATFSPDGRVIAVAADQSIILVDPDDARVISQTPTTQEMVALAFSPDRSRLGAWGGELCIFATDGLELLTVMGGVASAQQLLFTPDGNALLASSASTPLVALETGPAGDPRRRDLVIRADAAVNRAFADAHFVSDHAIARLQADETLTPDVLSVALSMARARADDPNQIQNVTLIRMPVAEPGPDWLRDVERMLIATRVLPDDLGLRLTLARCHLRAGQPREALAAAQLIIDRAPPTSHGLLGHAWILVALAQCELGKPIEAALAIGNAERHQEALGVGATPSFRALLAEARERLAAANGEK